MFSRAFSQKDYEKSVLIKQISEIHAKMYNITEFQDLKRSLTEMAALSVSGKI